MTQLNNQQKHAILLRKFRTLHRITGAFLFIVFLFISVSGILLGWKKHSKGFILPKSYTGISTKLEDWLPLDSLHWNACRILHDSVSPKLSTKLNRIDVRKDKGMVKFVFEDHYWGIQLDGSTGKLLHIERRRSDLIEQIHDASILDQIFGTNNGQIKLIYTTVSGLALLVFTITGFWLWFGTKRMRKNSQSFRK